MHGQEQKDQIARWLLENLQKGVLRLGRQGFCPGHEADLALPLNRAELAPADDVADLVDPDPLFPGGGTNSIKSG